MANTDNRKRWEILDNMLGSGGVSADDIFLKWKDNGILPKSFSENKSLRDQYELTLRQDLFKFRSIYKDSGLPGPLLDENGGQAEDGRKKFYRYSRKGWSIIPLISSKFTRSEWHALDQAMEKLKKDLPKTMSEQIDFLVMSRLNPTRGKTKTVDWPDVDNQLGFEILPTLHECILKKRPVRIEFTLFGEKSENFLLHPYMLKEYNGRWYCLGYREDKKEIWPISVDRVTPGSVNAENVHYIDYPENGAAELYFDNIIGVTKIFNETTARDFMVADGEYDVRIGIHSFRAWMYLVTNPIHHSQTIVQDFDSNKKYGSVTIRVIPNIEMYQTILGLGRDVCIEEPKFARQNLKEMLNEITKLY